MPGKCKFQESWLSKVIYKDWLMKDTHDIHFARCRACCKSIKLQTMGEAALTSHAGGAGHKAAVRKLMEGSVMMTNSAGRINGGGDQDDDSKVFLQDGIAGDDRQLSPDENSTSHNAELQDGTFVAAPGRSTSGLISQRLHWSGDEAEEVSQQQQQQQQMKILEWESRMKVLALEQELLREKRKAAQQKWRAFRMKKAYYRAKLRRLGEGLPPSSPSGSDEGEEKTSGPTG